MKQLSSGNIFLTKYVSTAVWAFATIATGIIEFEQFDGLYLAPLFMLVAIISYMPMKILYDDTRIVVSDLFTKQEYKYEDVKSLKLSRRGFISFQPYSQLELLMNDNTLRKVKFRFREQDIVKSLFSKEPAGRYNELLELWQKHTRQDLTHEKSNLFGFKKIGRMETDLAPRNLYRNILLANVILLVVLGIIHQFTMTYSVDLVDNIPFIISSVITTGQMLVIMRIFNKCRYITMHPTDETKFVSGNFFSNSYEPLSKLQVMKKIWKNLFKVEIDGRPYYIFAREDSVEMFASNGK